APDKQARKVCWAARDAYFACLDRANIVDANTPEADKACGELVAQFKASCPSSWVEYFKTRRVLDARQRAMMA
ncbi:cytochrome c oxidase, subunit VIb, partial [Thamnocephalis sphaerospora]